MDGSQLDPEVTKRLRAESERARQVYEQAKRERDGLLAIKADLGMENPDGRVAARQAIIKASQASIAYSRALTRYTYYLAKKTLPPETEAPPPDDPEKS
jgi:hypothetical protein